MISVKYVRNIDYFITKLLPYIEIWMKEFPNETIEICSNEIICGILKIMFGDRIIARVNKMNFYVLNERLDELEDYLATLYDIQNMTLHLSRPIIPKDNYNYLDTQNIICMFPKYKPSETYDNMSSEMIDDFIHKYNIKQNQLVLIGNPLDRLNTQFGKDIHNFNDIVCYLRHCYLFITSESYWVDVAVISNCRNIIIYKSNQSDKTMKHSNPFCSSIHVVDNLNCSTIEMFMNEINK